MRSRKFLPLTTFIGLLLTLFACNSIQQSQPKKTSYKPESINEAAKLVSSVSALGTLEPTGEVHILAGPMTQTGGAPRIKSILVAEGDSVYRNQLLVTFDNSSQLLEERNRILADIQSKNTEISLLRQQAKRFEQLTATGSFPVAEMEEKRVRLSAFQSQLQELRGTLKTFNARLYSDSVIRSPIDGIILNVNSRIGERPNENGVVEIGNTNQMQADLEVDESDIRLIRLGQSVTVKSENGAFDKLLHGNVSFIGLKASSKQKVGQDPGIAPDSEVRVINVKVKLDAKSSRIAKDLTGVKVIGVINVK